MSTTATQTGSVNEITKYVVEGQELTLTPQIIKDIICRGNNVPDDQVVKFMHLCVANKLNPFTNEVYLVGYKTKDGGFQAQMTISKEAYYKRADAHPEFEGIKSGVIILRNDEIIELEGSFYLQTDQVLGGWAIAYRKGRANTVAKVSLAEYTQNNTMWNTKPGTMIVKIAKVQALREAFPSIMSGIYTEEEISRTDPFAKVEKAPEHTPIDTSDIEERVRRTGSIEELSQIYKSLPDELKKDRNLTAVFTEQKHRIKSKPSVEEYAEYVELQAPQSDELPFTD